PEYGCRNCRNRVVGNATGPASRAAARPTLQGGTCIASGGIMSSFRPALVGALVLLGAVSVHAQATVDDLSCFLVRDQVPRGSVRAILNGLGGQSCRIKVPATFACIATQGTTVTPAPPASSQSGAFSSSVLCYRARCAPPRPPRTMVADAFGSRPVKFRGARWVCLPAAMGVSGGPTATTIPGSPVTTTTTPGTTATTPTLPPPPPRSPSS